MDQCSRLEVFSESFGRVTHHSHLTGHHHRSAVKWGAAAVAHISRRKQNGTFQTVLRLPDLDQAKSAVLNSLSSVDAQRGCRHAIDEFVECQLGA